MQLITEAAKEGVDLIHTFVYAKGPDDRYVDRVIDVVEKNGGEVCLVLLRCDIDELSRRVTGESRRAIAGKVVTPDMLRSLHEQYGLTSPFPGRESLVIENTGFPAPDTAELIIDHYRLVRTAAGV